MCPFQHFGSESRYRSLVQQVPQKISSNRHFFIFKSDFNSSQSTLIIDQGLFIAYLDVWDHCEFFEYENQR